MIPLNPKNYVTFILSNGKSAMQCISIDNNYNPATFSKNLRENRNYVGMIFGKSKFQMQKFRFRNISRVFQFRFSKNHSDIFTSCAWSHAKCCRIIIVVAIEPQSSFLNLEAKMKKNVQWPKSNQSPFWDSLIL